MAFTLPNALPNASSSSDKIILQAKATLLEYQRLYASFSLQGAYGKVQLFSENDRYITPPDQLTIKLGAKQTLLKEAMLIEANQEKTAQNQQLEWVDKLSLYASCHMVKPHSLHNTSLHNVLNHIFDGYPLKIATQRLTRELQIAHFQPIASQNIGNLLSRLGKMAGTLFYCDRQGDLRALEPYKKLNPVKNLDGYFLTNLKQKRNLRAPYIHPIAQNNQNEWHTPLATSFPHQPLKHGYQKILTEGGKPFHAKQFYNLRVPATQYKLEFAGIIDVMPGDYCRLPSAYQPSRIPKILLVTHSQFIHSPKHNGSSHLTLIET